MAVSLLGPSRYCQSYNSDNLYDKYDKGFAQCFHKERPDLSYLSYSTMLASCTKRRPKMNAVYDTTSTWL